MKHFILSVLLLTFCLAVSAQLDLYVSQTSGNDTNSGTSDDDAYATLSAAITASSDYNVTNPENQNVVIYISGGVYNVTGLNVVQNTQILYWDESDAPTVVNFQGNDKTKDTYFIVANTFVLNGDNGDGAISFRFDNLKTAISFDNTNATAVYTLSVLYTLFEEVYQGIYAVNVNQLLLQQSLFNSSYTADPINADGPGLGTDSNFEIDQTDFNNVAGVVNVENGYDEGILKDITWVGGTKGAFILVDGSWEVSDLNVTDATTGSTTSGAAIDFTNGIIEITDSHFTGCVAHNGGAVYLESVDASLTSVTFTDCTSIFSGGAYAHNGSYNTTSSMEDVTFQSNNATNYGGAIELYGAFLGLSLYNVAFNNNTAGINGSSIDCCGASEAASCTPATVFITDDTVSSLGNVGGSDITCPVENVDDFTTVVSVSNDSVNSDPNDDDDGSLVWLWVILSLLAVAVIIAIAAGAGYFVYRKRKMGQYAAVD